VVQRLVVWNEHGNVLHWSTFSDQTGFSRERSEPVGYFLWDVAAASDGTDFLIAYTWSNPTYETAVMRVGADGGRLAAPVVITPPNQPAGIGGGSHVGVVFDGAAYRVVYEVTRDAG